MSYPVIRINEGHDRRLRHGSPWLYSNELQIDRAGKALEPGSVVRLAAHDGRAMALAQFNPHSLIAARVLTRNTNAQVDRTFFERRLRRALALRDRLFATPHYRLVHAEADGLPGLIVDRFDATLVVQLNSAGAVLAEADLVDALERVLAPASIVIQADAPVRALEGLAEAENRVVGAEPSTTVRAIEAGLAFDVDVVGGQKTGWYYDQRLNRRFAAGLARDAEVLDLYSYSGGFGLTALHHGATRAILVDSSAPALGLAAASAEAQGVAGRIETRDQDVFPAVDALIGDKQRFGLVCADPPPFVRSRRDLPVGLKAYRKVARLAAALVAEGGYLCVSCCSHNVPEEDFAREIYGGIRSAGRSASLLHRAGAGPDHPVHPGLPESAYLKFLAYALD